ncbi:hypothetical protein [Microbacterium sp. 2FI]|uniref:hypothetical protein n=1 Tax=Microbacterium sp. 2FI TaxID=2502193 RepID=UPI0010F43B67|nr:hypothetical protein [Microbacterium sp. 2FI]
MSATVGTWNVEMKSPFGNQAFDLTFAEDPATGTMSGPQGQMQVDNLVFDDDDTVTFTVDVAKPMKLHIVWQLTAEGDSLSGSAKAGAFPAQKVTGTRA